MKRSAIVLGVVSLIAWLIPIAGVIVSGIGLGLSRKPDQEYQKPALILSSIGMVLAIGNWVAGTMMLLG